MQPVVQKLLVESISEVLGKIKAGTCEMTDTEAMELVSIFSHEPMSKEEASLYLNLSPSRFNALMKEGKIPQGRKRRGWNELCWYKDELDPKIRKHKIPLTR